MSNNIQQLITSIEQKTAQAQQIATQELTNYQQDLKAESQKELMIFSADCDQKREQIQKQLEQNLTQYQTAEAQIHQQIQAIISLPTITLYILIWALLSIILSILILAWSLQKLLIILLTMSVIGVSLTAFYLIYSRQQLAKQE